MSEVARDLRPPSVDVGQPPFAVPGDIVLDLPCPPSVNRSRRADGKGIRKLDKWKGQAHVAVLAARCRTHGTLLPGHKMLGAFEALIVLNEKMTKIDLDNGVKAILDYAKTAGLIVDDGPKYLRRLIVEWGAPSLGCRLTLRPMASAEAIP